MPIHFLCCSKTKPIPCDATFIPAQHTFLLPVRTIPVLIHGFKNCMQIKSAIDAMLVGMPAKNTMRFVE